MNEPIETVLKHMSGYTVVIWVMFFVAVIGGIIASTIKIYRILEKYREMRNFQENHIKEIEKHSNAIAELKKAQDSLKFTQNEICACLQETNANVQNLVEKIDDMSDRQDKQDQARLKNIISQQYSIYHKSKEITEMQKESLISLIKAFEIAGNHNTFVHETVEPELYTWTVIEE